MIKLFVYHVIIPIFAKTAALILISKKVTSRFLMGEFIKGLFKVLVIISRMAPTAHESDIHYRCHIQEIPRHKSEISEDHQEC